MGILSVTLPLSDFLPFFWGQRNKNLSFHRHGAIHQDDADNGDRVHLYTMQSFSVCIPRKECTQSPTFSPHDKSSISVGQTVAHKSR